MFATKKNFQNYQEKNQYIVTVAVQMAALEDPLSSSRVSLAVHRRAHKLGAAVLAPPAHTLTRRLSDPPFQVLFRKLEGS